MTCRLLQLPPELLSSVVERVDNNQDLRSLAVSCSQLQSPAEHQLYAHVRLRDLSQVSQLHQSLLSRTERANSIETIESVCRRGFTAGEYAPRSIIHAARNLKELIVESPFCNDCFSRRKEAEWQSVLPDVLHSLGMPSISPDPFPRLASLTVHWSGRSQRYWTITPELIGIFAHQNLKNLTLSCAEITKDALDGLKGLSSTPLATLVLIECNVHLDAVAVMLSLPKALRRFQLGQSAHHYHQTPGTLQGPIQEPSKLFDALDQQSGSLEHFAYIEKDNENDANLPVGCSAFLHFERLSSMIVEGDCKFIMQALLEKHAAPPSLQSLTLKDTWLKQFTLSRAGNQDHSPATDWLLQTATLMKSLLEIKVMAHGMVFSNKAAEIARIDSRLKTKGTTLRMIQLRRQGAIPPILDGEKGEVEKLIYSSETGMLGPKRSAISQPLQDLSTDDSDGEGLHEFW